ncbi:MAG: hypothetical protein AAGH89_12275, partial [Verrucomicrobiota bacterium]
AVTAIAASPWAPLVAIGGQKQVILYNSDSYELLGILPFEEGFPETVSFSANGSLLVAGGGRGGKSGKAVAWDVETGDRVVEVGREFDTALAADISPNHQYVTLGGPGRNIKIFDTTTGEQLHSIKKHPDWLLEAEYSPDGVLLTTGGRNGGLYVWEAEAGMEFYELKEHQQAITGISWRGDSNVVGASSEDGNVSLWEMQNGRQIKKWSAHGGGALAIDFSPDGSKVATAGRDNRLKIWDLNGKLLREIKEFSDVVTAVVFTHDGKKVISGDWNGQLKVWNVDDGKLLGSLISNPPSIAQQMDTSKRRVAEITKSLPALEEVIKKAAEAAAAGKKARDSANGQLSAVKKQKADSDSLVKNSGKMLADLGNLVKKAEGEYNKKNGEVAAKLNMAKNTPEHKKLAGLVNDAKGKEAEIAKQRELAKQLTAQIAQGRKDLPSAENQYEQAAKNRADLEARVKGLQLQVEQVPDNQDFQKALVEAKAAFSKADGSMKAADAKRREVGTKLKNAEAGLVAAKNAEVEGQRSLKVAQLLVEEQKKVAAEAEKKAMPQAEKEAESVRKELVAYKAKVDAAKKNVADAQKRIADAKKVLAGSDAAIKSKEGAAKSATDRYNQLAAAQTQAQNKAKQAKFDLAFMQYQVDKWAAAEVNVVLHKEQEMLESYHERLLGYEGQTQNAIAQKDAAIKAIEDAKKTLEGAKQTIAETTKVLDTASDDVVEVALQLVAARSLAEPETKAPKFEEILEATYKKVEETSKLLTKATETVSKAPGVISEREKAKLQKEAELKKALEQKKRQEGEIQQQSRRVDELEEKYRGMYREWEEDTVAAK